ncbi:DUF4397 domain-containing protein [Mucilaginibacter sp. L3T2-6]|uniref:DUF4397 domain-containing protein n=1 Tax=Mucilaginibacter sp. L3T2-6 TaxID=3062491 RepID=UPI0026748735|nr:DUF4397 domain-containing protein [Mucilaginibacter sp. L3T2-6]MDO3644645.1 DUF4397 domain-containing protein [Mucilaginibacter sp. L3T2-6]MDV6217097.1 DUF4397 domain-containing protein [Mucilaginibacter sp. L3T2-6]
MNLRLTCLFLITAISGLVSCKNNDNVFPQKNPDATFKIINASPNTINYYLNGTRLNNGTSLSTGVATPYIATTAGQQNFGFKLNGSADVLFNWPEKMIDSVNYSLYITGNTADKAFRTRDTLIVDSGFVSVGFVNAAPNAGALDVSIGDTLRFKAAGFKSQAKYTAVANGDREIKVYKAGTTTLLKDTVCTMNQNSIYTIYTYGTPGATGSSQFGVGITRNL